MAFTYDVTTNVGLVRLLIPDRIETEAIFQDAEIEAFLTMASNNVQRATAKALDTIASDQTLVLKVIRTLDVSTDGAAISRELRERAKQLRIDASDDETSEDGALFDYAEMVTNAFTERERVVKQAQREDD